MTDSERTDPQPVFLPDEGLEAAQPTARDAMPHRGLIADLQPSGDLLPEPDDTTDGAAVMDRTVPIASDTIARLLAEVDGEEDTPFDPEAQDDLSLEEFGESTEVDLSAAASAVAAELMGPAGTPDVPTGPRIGPQRASPSPPGRRPPAPAPSNGAPRPTPPMVAPPRPRPAPRAPSLSMPEPPAELQVELQPSISAADYDPTVALAAAARAAEHRTSARPLAEPPPSTTRPAASAAVIVLVGFPLVVFLAWWLS